MKINIIVNLPGLFGCSVTVEAELHGPNYLEEIQAVEKGVHDSYAAAVARLRSEVNPYDSTNYAFKVHDFGSRRNDTDLIQVFADGEIVPPGFLEIRR